MTFWHFFAGPYILIGGTPLNNIICPRYVLQIFPIGTRPIMPHSFTTVLPTGQVLCQHCGLGNPATDGVVAPVVDVNTCPQAPQVSLNDAALLLLNAKKSEATQAILQAKEKKQKTEQKNLLSGATMMVSLNISPGNN
eukprot:gb/GEZN01013567.1/.p1 GENE.gb/GEZN01013567.1/~~gb/GEZN01013567.1/.p1  ORF type:complete len:138 (+),score=7.40 gb/GEZN01013567.1/:126-539(+)